LGFVLVVVEEGFKLQTALNVVFGAKKQDKKGEARSAPETALGMPL